VTIDTGAEGPAETVERIMGTGRTGEARALAQALLATSGLAPGEEAGVRLALSSILALAGRAAEAVEHADAVLATPDLPQELYVAADVHRLNGLVIAGDIGRAQTHAEATLAGEAYPAGDTDLAGALATMGLAAWMEGRLADTATLMRAAVRRAEHGPFVLRHLSSLLGHAVVSASLGDFEGAAAATRMARRDITVNGDRSWEAGAAVLEGWIHGSAGRLDEAADSARSGLELSERLEASWFDTSAHWVLGTVALHRGDLPEAARHVAAYQSSVEVSLPWPGGLSRGAYVWLAARVAEAQGRADLAADILRPVYDGLLNHRRLLADEPASAASLVRAALVTGDRWRAARVVTCIDQVAASNPGVPTVAAAAAHARGLLDRDPAVVAWAARTHRHPWATASAHEDVSLLLVEAGNHREAAEHLDAAAANYERAGAVRDVTRVRGRHRRLVGGRDRRNGSPRSGWASLTDTERRVAVVVAEGRTNAEAAGDLYMSPHTVDTHLRHIYRKLGIGSRVELARLVVHRETEGRTPAPGQPAVGVPVGGPQPILAGCWGESSGHDLPDREASASRTTMADRRPRGAT
jgi:ATP/maltotriose-dependent transcriptional regulator MalT